MSILVFSQAINKMLRYYYWIIRGFYSKYTRIIITSFIVGLFVVIFGRSSVNLLVLNLQKDHQVVGIVGSYTPSTLPLFIQQLISSGLTEVGENFEVKPALSDSWEINVEGKEYIFHLKNNIFWHDGTKFTAYDVNYNLKDVEFVVDDEMTLRIKLKKAFSPLPSFLIKPLFKKGLIGTGLYRVDKVRLKGEYITYLKLKSNQQDLPVLEYKFYASENIAKTAFKIGEINSIEDVLDPTPFTDWKLVKVVEKQKYTQIVTIFFNLNDPLLKEKNFRQALSFITEKTDKYRVVSPLPSKSWAYTTRVKQYDIDVDQANKLIKNYESSISSQLKLSTFQPFIALAQRIISQWKALGINAEIKLETGIPSEYQALLISQEVPLDPDQYNLWHSTQTQTNISHYANPKIDKLLEVGRQEIDLEKRKKTYFDFQRYLVEDAPAIFLYHPTTYTISRR